MKIFKSYEEAHESYHKKEEIYLNSLCPFNSEKLCGNWCALFKIDKVGDKGAEFILINCKENNKRMYL